MTVSIRCQAIYAENDQGKRKLLAEGYEFERLVKAEINGKEEKCTERVLVVRSERYQQTMVEGLKGRLRRATEELMALTPAPGRGKRQIQDESELVIAAEAILKAHDVERLLSYTFELQEKPQTKSGEIGRFD